MPKTKYFNFVFPSPLWDMVLASETTGAHYDGIDGFYPRDSRWCKDKSRDTLQLIYQQILESRELLIGKPLVIAPGLGYEGEVSELLKFIDQLELAIKDYFEIVPDNAQHSGRSINTTIPLQDRRVEHTYAEQNKQGRDFRSCFNRRFFLVGVCFILIFIFLGFLARDEIRGAYLMGRVFIESFIK